MLDIGGKRHSPIPLMPVHTTFDIQKHDNSTFDHLLHLCWPIQDGWSCVGKGPCSWCPTVKPILHILHVSSLTPVVLNMRAEHCQNTYSCPNIQCRYLPALVRKMGIEDSSIGTSHFYHHVLGWWTYFPSCSPICLTPKEHNLTVD